MSTQINISKPIQLEVNTTPITSGTVGRLLFQGTGNVLQQSSSLFWDLTNNRLGVGTNTPSQQLHVFTSVADTGILLDSNTNPTFTIRRSGSDRLRLTATGSIGTINGVGNGLVFQRDGSEAMRIAPSTGNLLINTTTDNGYKFEVSGTARIQGTSFDIFSTGSSYFVESSINNYRIANLISWGGYGTGGFANNTADIFSVGVNGSSTANANYFFRINLNGGNSSGVYGASGNNAAVAQLNAPTAARLYLTAQGGGGVLEGGTSGVLLSTISDGQSLSLRSEKGTGGGGGGINYLSSINGSNHSHRFFHNNTEQMRLQFSGNLLINTTTDAGFRLDVNGTARVQGNSFEVTNGATNKIAITSSQISCLAGVSVSDLNIVAGPISAPNSILGIGTTVSGGSTTILRLGAGNATNASGIVTIIESPRGFAPTSGTATFSFATWNGTINQTGGANGITRGLYIAPTLTSAADFRAIETAAGNVIFNGGNVGIGTSSPTNILSIKQLNSNSSILRLDSATTVGSNTYEVGVDFYSRITGAGGTDSSPVGKIYATGGAEFRSGKLRFQTIITNGGSLTDTMTLYQGNVGIGSLNTLPSKLLQVTGLKNTVVADFSSDTVGLNEGVSIQLSANAGNYPLGVIRGIFTNYGGYSALTFSTSTLNTPTEAIRITSNQNVLIGTTTDAGFKLDVNGTARVATSILVGPGSTQGTIQTGVCRATFYNSYANAFTIFETNNSSGNAKFYQGISIGTSSDPVASAQLEVVSTTKGFLPPKMTTTQKNAIASPATGLQVYDTTLNRPCFYDGTTWITL